MTPEQKVKQLILMRNAEFAGAGGDHIRALSGEQVDLEYDDLVASDAHWDAKNEVREGEVETGIPCEWSRHYESKAVAARAADGSWVGWTYWYGGGKHGEPEAIDWIDDAYNLDCVEEERTMTVRTFTVPQVAA